MQRVETSRWHEAVAASIDNGYCEFVTLMGLDDDGLAVWLLLRNADGEELVIAAAASDELLTVTDLLPEAAWYEREAAEMFGIRFLGHDTAPLLLQSGMTPPMPKAVLLDARQATPWPGEKDPGGTLPRRRALPPGVAGGPR